MVSPFFFAEGDRSRLCLLLQQGVERYGHRIEAFCFMSNHIHLAVRVADISISRIMQHLACRYAQYINRRYKRIGHLFQGRFKSVLVDDEDYLKELIRYIHLNPVRAKLVSDPLQYPWSSHRAYMEMDEFSWLDKDRVLRKFYPDRENALMIYEKYLLKGIGVETEFDFKSGLTAGMIGSREFVDEVMATSRPAKQRKIELADLVKKICETHHLTQQQLCMPGKQAQYSQARALLALFVREIDHLSLESLGKFLERDPSGLTALANRLGVKIDKHPLVAKNVEEIRRWLQEAV